MSRNLLSSSSVLSAVLLSSFFSLASPIARAQDLTHKAPPQSKPITIYNATIHPLTAAKPDETIDNGFITFDKGVITAIGSGKPPSTPETSIDAKGLHIYPGLIGARTQLGLVEFSPVRPSNDTSETGGITPEVRPLTAVNPDSTLLPVTRSNGILTV